MKKLTVILLTLLMVFSAMAAAADTITIDYWQFDSRPGDRDGAHAVAEAFMEKHPDVEIKVDFVAWETADQKFMSAVMADNAPDTFQNWWTTKPHVYNNAMPLDEYYEDWEGKDDVYDVTLNYINVQDEKGLYLADEIDEEFIGVPTFQGTDAIFYDAEALNEAGVDPEKDLTTFEGIRDAAKKLTEDSEGDRRWGFPIIGTGVGEPVNMLYTFLNAWGARRVVDGKAALTSGKAYEGAEFYIDLFREHEVVPSSVVNDDYKEVTELFLNGTVPMVMGLGSWTIGDMQEAYGDDLKTVPYPEGPVTDPTPNPRSCTITAMDTEVTREHPDIVWEWLEFWNTYEGQKAWFEAGGCGLPTNTEYGEEMKESSAVYEGLIDGLSTARSLTAHPAWSLFSSDPETMSVVQAAFLGDITPREMLDTLNERLQEKIDQVNAEEE